MTTNIRKGVRQLLVATTSVSALAGARVYWDGVLPQNPTFPAVTIHQISSEHHGHLGGKSGLAETVLRVDSWTEDAGQANKLDQAIRAKIDMYSGAAGVETIDRAYAETMRDGDIRPPSGSRQWLYRRQRDCRIFHAETT